MSPLLPRSDAFWWSGNSLVSEDAFKISIWVCTSLCVVLAVLRFLIRLLSFRRLFVEDYLMIFSLMILIALSAFLQRFLGDIYGAITSRDDVTVPGPESLDKLMSAMRTAGVAMLLSTVGIWAIKLNFLSFFRGFGRQIKSYTIFWWISFVLVVACGIAQLGFAPYRCLFSNLPSMIIECSSKSGTEYIKRVYEAAVAVDIVSDGIIIGFPVFIVWRTKINLRQKLLLTGIFLLVGFTITVTILRGVFFGGIGKTPGIHDDRPIDPKWTVFSFFIQYAVSFIIACIISFRSMWVKQERRLKRKNVQNGEKHPRAHGHLSSVQGDKNARWKQVHDTLMQTLRDLEGADMEWDGSYLINHEPPSGRLTIDFSRCDSTFASGSSAYATASTQHSEAQMASSV